jgi:hypothetical protein
MAEVSLNLNGKLNFDDDISALNGGDYPMAFNVESQNLKEGFARTPTLGNKECTDLGVQPAQNQKVRVTIQDQLSSSISQINVSLFNGNGRLIASGSSDVNLNNQVIKNAIANILNNISPFPVSYSVPDSTSSFEIEINANFADWRLVIEVDDEVIPNLQVVVIQEAVDATGAGQFLPIGWARAGNGLIVFSTTQRNLPRRLAGNIQSITQDLQGRVLITMPFVHGLEQLTSVNIGGVSDGGSVNGTWTIFIVNTTTFGLYNSVFSGSPTGGSVFSNVYGYGCIGLFRYNNQTDTYTYTKLLRSKKLNFNTKKQIDADAEVSNDRISCYYTDDYNSPRNFYYKGVVSEDGAINAINSANIYNYETLSIQAQNIVDYSDYDVEVVLPQIQSGGETPSGTLRYSIQFLTENFTATENSRLTNIIHNYAQEYDPDDTTKKVYGSTGFTPKINRIRVSGIQPNIFKYVELICHEYAGIATTQAINSFIVRREVLDEGQTEIVLEHNGSEPNPLSYDTGESILLGSHVKTAKTQAIVDNTLIYANITTHAETNIQDWVDTFNYRIIRRETRAGKDDNGNFITFGEFYDPSNITNNVGYMPYEWYRFYVSVKFKNNQQSKSFFFADVRFVPNQEYIDQTNRFHFDEFKESNKRNKRASSPFDQYDINVFGDNNEIYQLGIEVTDIDWGYLINGVVASELIDEIYIERKPVVKEVLGACAFMITDFSTSNQTLNTAEYNIFAQQPLNQSQITLSGNAKLTSRIIGAYCPDWYFTGEYPNIRSSDEIITIGKPNLTSVDSTIGTNPNSRYLYINYNQTFARRLTEITKVSNGGLVSVGLRREMFVDVNTGITIFLNAVSRIQQPNATFNNNGVTAYPYIGLYLDSNLNSYFQPSDSSLQRFVYGFYFRKRKDKYGSTISGDTESTGAKAKSGESACEVFGGDTFFQSQTIKYFRTNQAPQGIGMAFFSHNRINVNLRTFDNTAIGKPFGISTQTSTQWLEELSFDQTRINPAYTTINRIQSTPVFDPNLIETPAMKTRMYYSEEKPQNSIKDNYREFNPFNFRDKDLTEGEITRVLNVNGGLVVFQERNMSVEYFDSSGRLKVAEGGDVIFGDGSKLSRKGNDLTQYGTKHQFAIVEGVSVGGKKTLYCINTDYGVMTRFGADGTVDLGLRDKMRSFFMEYTRFAKDALTPADGYGITGIWDARKMQVVMTCRAWNKNIAVWGREGRFPFAEYPEGFVLSYLTEQDIPVFYRTKKLTPLTINPFFDVRDNGGEYYERVSYWESEYYNVWTLIYSEKESRFKHFNGFYPKFYMNLDERYFSSNPDADRIIYRYDDNEPLVFFGNEQPGYVEMVMNVAPEIPKKMVGLAVQSTEKPIKAECESEHISRVGTSNRKAIMEFGDFTTQQNYHYAPILNNFVDGSSKGKTEQLRGLYLKVRMFFMPRQKQILRRLSVKIREQFKNIKS